MNMAFRKIHDDFWTDPDIEELTPEQKFFYIYLITNPSVNQIGLYEFSMKRACFETGYNIDTVSKLLAYFEDIGKIKRSNTTREILVIKFYFHNKSNSPKVKTHVEQLLKNVKDTSLIQYIYSMDIASQEEEEKEEVQEQKKEQENITRINGVPLNGELDKNEIEWLQKFIDYLKETHKIWQTSMQTQLTIAEMLQFKEKGHDVVKIIKTVIMGNHKKLYEPDVFKKTDNTYDNLPFT